MDDSQKWYHNFGVVIFSGFLLFVADFFIKNYAVANLSEKWISMGIVKLHLVSNDRMAFSIPINQIVIIALAAFVVIAFLQYFAVCVRDGLYANLWAANLVIWGAFSNLYDRLYRGYVVDYIHIGPLPVMNISDIAIVAGLIALLFLVKRHERQWSPAASRA